MAALSVYGYGRGFPLFYEMDGMKAGWGWVSYCMLYRSVRRLSRIQFDTTFVLYWICVSIAPGYGILEDTRFLINVHG